MPDLSIKEFSCIKSANFSLRRLNIIIGPQGSGKSVTTKLIYFFADILQDAVRNAEDGLSLSEFKRHLEKTFSVWFPPGAWGAKRSFINYTDGDFSVRVMRRMAGGIPRDEVSVKFSRAFDKCYDFAYRAFLELRAESFESTADPERLLARSALEVGWRTRDTIWKHFSANLGHDIVRNQTFIPAGRAFFTSIGRMVAGIERGGSLDPATLKFAKIFASWRDQLDRFDYQSRGSVEHRKLRDRIMGELFGGLVQAKRGSEFIEMGDGRKVPFSSLSSGQQELLPIWYFLDNLMSFDIFLDSRKTKGAANRRDGEIIYIEEPEAHLFPEAQSLLLDIMVEVVLGGSPNRKLVLTTHSPYIMAKLNVLLKAGQISKRKKKNKELGEIVEKSRWLLSSDVSALSIVDGCLHSIVDETEGLVDAGFLDSISNAISEQFLALLDLEASI